MSKTATLDTMSRKLRQEMMARPVQFVLHALLESTSHPQGGWNASRATKAPTKIYAGRERARNAQPQLHRVAKLETDVLGKPCCPERKSFTESWK
jgi:hypothetical protein